MPARAAPLFVDETILRLFPPLRAKWAWRGEQATVRVTGRSAKRVLFGAVDPRTGRRLVMRGTGMRQEQFQAFLRLLRGRHRGRPLVLLLDDASCHTAARTRRLAAGLKIDLVPLPKQWSELNAMDHLWRDLKRLIAANRQYATADQLAEWAERWVHGLTPRAALRKAGVLSDHFWLKPFV